MIKLVPLGFLIVAIAIHCYLYNYASRMLNELQKSHRALEEKEKRLNELWERMERK